MATNRYQGVDQILSNLSLAYTNSAYVADEIFRALPVKFQSGKHFEYDRGRFRVTDSLRGAGARSKEVTHNITVGQPYFCEDHALKEFVADEDVDNAVPPADPFADTTENVTERHFIAKEKELADMLTDTAVLTQNTTLSGTSQWSDFSNSNPIKVVKDAKQTVHAAIHIDPNTLILGKPVYDALLDHRSMSYIWGKNAVLAYISQRVAPKMITLGLTYQWKQRQVERLRGTDEEDRKGTFVRVGNHYYDQKMVSTLCGFLIKNAVA